MIKQVSHTVAGNDPAGFALALAVAYELNAPTAAVRAPEISPAAARRTARSRSRRTVRG
jgi:adenine/guanine phosphoribosyltransferase-like PRPP-binding protein